MMEWCPRTQHLGDQKVQWRPMKQKPTMEHTEIAIESYRISTGWWLSKPLWKMMEFVSWDYDIPNWMESHSKFHGSSHHQPVTINH